MNSNRKRKHQISIRLNDNEYEIFKTRLNETSLSQRKYIFNLIVNTPIFCIHELDIVEEQIRKIGVNINQIAKKVNTNSQATENELIAVKKEQIKIWQLLKQLKVVHL